MPEKMMYVKFDKETGNIISIKGREYTEENSIPVPFADVERILDGLETIDSYEIRYNTKLKKMEFASRAESTIIGSTINDFIYEVPEDPLESPDILIMQDVKNSCWKIFIGQELRSNLRSKGVTVNQRMMLSITAKGDPNVLYKTLFVELSDAVRDNYVVLPFTMPFEQTDEQISIFTARRFDTYQFKRIFNEFED